jgi:hypothetical protein
MTIRRGRHYAYADLTEAEYAYLKACATREGLTVSNYVRRCVNSLWLEEGRDDAPLLEECTSGIKRGRPRHAD